MAASARIYNEHERTTPQSMAQALLEQDAEQTAPASAARVTVLHSKATDVTPKARKPRAARPKVAAPQPVNQEHGFAEHRYSAVHDDAPRGVPMQNATSIPARTPSAPVTGQAPSVLHTQDAGSAARAALSKPVTAPVQRSAHAQRGLASSIARAPGFVMAAMRWSKNVLLGSGLAFMERVPTVLSPVAFVFANLITILIGIAYCALPAGMGLFLLSRFPALHDAFVVAGPMKVVYMGLLYVTCGFVAMVGAFALRALAMGVARSLNAFADKGKDAFNDVA